MDPERVLAILEDHAQELAESGVSSLRPFRSVARGEAGPSSDVDFLVEFSRPVGLLAVARPKARLEAILSCPVDPVAEDALKPPCASTSSGRRGMPPGDFTQRVEDMLDAMARTQRCTAGMTYEGFAPDPRTVDAVIKNVALMGEAAAHLPERLAEPCPGLPLAEMRTMRNLIIHEYFGTSLAILWQTVTQDIPPLIPHIAGVADMQKQANLMNLRHKILGMTLASAVMFGVGTARADTVVPLVTPNTTITLTNATGKTETGNVEFNQMGIQRGNGTKVPYSISAFSEQTIPSPVTDTNILNSQYATIEPNASNAEPIVNAFDCDNGNGHNVPTWSLDKINNTSPLAGELRTGDEYILFSTGTQNWPTSCTITRRNENNSFSATSDATHWTPSSVIVTTVSALAGVGLGPSQTIEQHFQNDGSQGYSAILYTDPASLDTRISEMKKYTPVQQLADQIAKAYVNKWLTCTDCSAYFSNEEIRAAINGTSNTRSYAPDIAQMMYVNNTDVFTSVSDAETWLNNQVDGNDANGELWRANDPFGWNARAPPIVAFLEEPDASVKIYKMDATTMSQMYNLFKNDFLVKHVLYNPQLYGGTVSGYPDMNFNPTLNTQDPN